MMRASRRAGADCAADGVHDRVMAALGSSQVALGNRDARCGCGGANPVTPWMEEGAGCTAMAVKGPAGENFSGEAVLRTL